MKSQSIDHSGEKYGKLTLLEKVKIFSDKSKRNKVYYRCKCECGKEKIIIWDSIKIGNSKSCGCLSHDSHVSKDDHSGEKFGKLLLLEKITKFRSGRNRTYYKCLCDCGNEKTMRWTNLNSNGTISCGCARNEAHKYRRKPSEDMSFNRLLHSYIQGANHRGLRFELSKDDFKKLTKENCHYCGVPPTKLICVRRDEKGYIYNGIDRVDSSKGYINSNCVSCCEHCNIMKMDYKESEFLEQVEKIYLHSVGKK